MMKATDQGRLDDPALIAVLHRSGLRGVLVEGKVCSGTVVVDEVVAQQATQMGLVEDDDVIEALAAQGADEAFAIGILSRRPRRSLDFADPQGLDSAGERDPVDRIAVAQEVAWGGLPGERLHELPGRPLGRGGVGDVDVDDASPVSNTDVSPLHNEQSAPQLSKATSNVTP